APAVSAGANPRISNLHIVRQSVRGTSDVWGALSHRTLDHADRSATPADRSAVVCRARALRPRHPGVFQRHPEAPPVIPTARIANDFRRTGALNTLVTIYGFIDDNVFLTKSGDLGVVLALDGVDDDCLDNEQREAVTRRFEVALRVLDESIRLSQYLLKQNHIPNAHRRVADPLIDSLLARRDGFLKAK